MTNYTASVMEIFNKSFCTTLLLEADCGGYKIDSRHNEIQRSTRSTSTMPDPYYSQGKICINAELSEPSPNKGAVMETSRTCPWILEDTFD